MCLLFLSFRWRPEINVLMDQLAAKMSSGSQVKKATMKNTKPQEFSLTKPKPRPLLMPELIPQQEKHKPVSLLCIYTHSFFEPLSNCFLRVVF